MPRFVLTRVVAVRSAARRGRTLLHAGFVRAGGAPGNAKAGDICESVVRTQQGNYLANLVLYPGAVGGRDRGALFMLCLVGPHGVASWA